MRAAINSNQKIKKLIYLINYQLITGKIEILTHHYQFHIYKEKIIVGK